MIRQYCYTIPLARGLIAEKSPALQCYLKDAAARIETDMQRAAAEGWKFGAKTVRGAYMVVERARAAEKGYESPIWDSLQETHDNYNRCAHIICFLQGLSKLFQYRLLLRQRPFSTRRKLLVQDKQKDKQDLESSAPCQADQEADCASIWDPLALQIL